MPPKKNTKGEIPQKEDRLQAVVLSDSYETRFMPLTKVRPRCLLPLANVPLIEYTLEFLARAGVDEVYVMCSSHADQVQEYLDNSKWSRPWSPFKVMTIPALESFSVGDAMRDLDNRGLITSDFLLVSGDVISNIQFDEALKAHKECKARDRNTIMTMVLRESSSFHRTRSVIESAVYAFDQETNRCLAYADLPMVSTSHGHHKYGSTRSSIEIDAELLEQHENLAIRNDLIDCHVDICTPQVPILFQENFDYQNLRSDFVKGILTSDILGKTIYGYFLSGTQYAARVESIQTYDAVSKDVIERWAYPVCPDSNILEDQTYSYSSAHAHGHMYKEAGVVLAHSCIIRSGSVIGSHTSIGEGTEICGSVLGRNCQIGNNVKLNNAYVWDGVVIEDNVSVTNSIIGYNAVLKAGCDISEGSIVGMGVIIGTNKKVASAKIIKDKPEDSVENTSMASFIESDEEDSVEENREEVSKPTEKEEGEGDDVIRDPAVVGSDGVGFLFESEAEDEDDDGFDTESVSTNSSSQPRDVLFDLGAKLRRLNISDCSIDSFDDQSGGYSHRRTGSQGSGHSLMPRKKKGRSYSTNSMVSATTAASDDIYAPQNDEENFSREAILSLERAFQENHELDTAVLELNTLRMAMNVSYHEVRKATVTALLNRIYNFIDTNTLGAKDAVTKTLTQWCAFFRRQVFDPEDEVDLLLLFQKECASKKRASHGATVLFHVVNYLYEEDYVAEERIYAWWDSPESTASEKLTEIRSLTGKFVQWLKDAEEESSGEE